MPGGGTDEDHGRWRRARRILLALPTKKARPDWSIDVYEQNGADDTFGFGVVFSDDTLDEFLSRDPEAYGLIRDRFASRDDVAIR